MFCRSFFALALAVSPWLAASTGAMAQAQPAEIAQAQPTELAAGCTMTPPQIYERVGDSVVQVISFGIDPYRVAGRVRPGTGSGILIEPGLVLTNYHVVQGSQLIGVQANGTASQAQLIGADPALDIALLQLALPVSASAAPVFGSSDDLVVGEPAYVLGYPLGIGRSFSSGIISGLERMIPLNTISWTTRYIQTDAPVSAGNSGGALLDRCGRIVGMVSMRSADPRSENLGYALPVDSILPLIDELRDSGHVARPWHGLYGQMMNPLIAQLMMGPFLTPEGFLVETIEPGSAADKAGLRGGVFPVIWGQMEILLGGDVITHVNGAPIRTLDEALAAVGMLEIGQSVDLVVFRDGETLEITAHIEERPVFERDLWVPGR